MRHEGLVVFLLFFGLALLDAVAAGHWLLVILWLAVGACFVLLDSWSQRRHVTPRRGDRPFWT